MKIDELLDKYFEGETSCEEERELRRFFTPLLSARIGVVPAHVPDRNIRAQRGLCADA